MIHMYYHCIHVRVDGRLTRLKPQWVHGSFQSYGVYIMGVQKLHVEMWLTPETAVKWTMGVSINTRKCVKEVYQEVTSQTIVSATTVHFKNQVLKWWSCVFIINNEPNVKEVVSINNDSEIKPQQKSKVQSEMCNNSINNDSEMKPQQLKWSLSKSKMCNLIIHDHWNHWPWILDQFCSASCFCRHEWWGSCQSYPSFATSAFYEDLHHSRPPPQRVLAPSPQRDLAPPQRVNSPQAAPATTLELPYCDLQILALVPLRWTEPAPCPRTI